MSEGIQLVFDKILRQLREIRRQRGEDTSDLDLILGEEDESLVGRLRTTAQETEDRIVVENLLPELKADLPLNAFTDQKLENIIRGSIRQQRLLTPYGLRFPDSRLVDIFRRALFVASRETPGSAPYTLPTHTPPPSLTPPLRRGDNVYKPPQRFYGGRHPPIGAFGRGSPIQPPALRRRQAAQAKNPNGLWVRLRVNVTSVETEPSRGRAGAPEPEIRITGAARGSDGSGILGPAA